MDGVKDGPAVPGELEDDSDSEHKEDRVANSSRSNKGDTGPVSLGKAKPPGKSKVRA